MKKLNRIKLHNLSQAELAKREENLLRGGKAQCACAGGAYCPCKYDGPQTDINDPYYGGATDEENFDANFDELVTNVNYKANNPQ